MEVFALAIIGGGKEQEAFKILKNNAKCIADVVKKFEELIVAYFSEKDFVLAQKLGRELSELETTADDGRRDFMSMLAKGAFLPAFRGNLAGLAEGLDKVADTTEGTVRAILLREHLLTAIKKAEKKNKEIREWKLIVVDMAKRTTQTVEVLQEAINALTTDIEIALTKANEVDILEHEVDLIEERLLNDLYGFEKLFDPLSVVQLADVIRRLGNISDRAEDMSDYIAIVTFTLTA